MKNYKDLLLEKIGNLNSKQAEKLKENLKDMDENYHLLSNSFYEKYENYLISQNLTLDYGVACYLKMIEDMLEERFKFIQTGNYSNHSFEDVERNVYSRPEIMTYHMHGLILAQFLWFDQYERINFFRENLNKHFQKGKNYLEIGGGHALYAYVAMNELPESTHFDLVDISESSLSISKGILNSTRVNFYLRNIFDFTSHDVYDFITVGEVIEHLEEPLELLEKIGSHLSNNGVCYLTTPVNSPMIDHIYLFNNENEIRNLIYKAGFEILEEKVVISEKISSEKAIKFKVPIMYAAFIKKVNHGF
jgi:ubiquinone/menaquinone biosynthesis C-methylase UbiE